LYDHSQSYKFSSLLFFPTLQALVWKYFVFLMPGTYTTNDIRLTAAIRQQVLLHC
jgi:hypothetical protein